MPRSLTTNAIVLKTYDVGEADRFCVLLTQERGRIAARARAVRKPKSKMGGSLLSPNSVTVDLTEGRSGWLVTGVQMRAERSAPRADQFAHQQHGIELLLSLVQDEEPLPEIFACTEHFLATCRNRSGVLSFTTRLLHHLGLLPDPISLRLSDEEAAYLRTVRTGEDAPLTDKGHERLSALFVEWITDHGSRALKSPAVVEAFQ